jgi:hypothetical protein
MPTYQAQRDAEGDWRVYEVDRQGAVSSSHKKVFYREKYLYVFAGWKARKWARLASKPPKVKKVKQVTYTNGKQVQR